MATLTDGFEILIEKQVTLIIKGTYNSAISSILQIQLETVATGNVSIVSKIEINKIIAGESFASFTLRLQPGKYRWKSELFSANPTNIVKPKLYREFFLIHDDLAGGLPFGMLGNISASATNNLFILFSGISGRKITVGARANCNTQLSGTLTVENVTTGLTITSPNIFNVFNNSEIWTEISFLNINYGNIYKASFNVVSADLNSLNSFISLNDNTP